MAAIMGLFQIVWVYYGLLIASRPVIAWNTVAVMINSLSVRAYFRFARNEREQAPIMNSSAQPRGWVHLESGIAQNEAQNTTLGRSDSNAVERPDFSGYETFVAIIVCRLHRRFDPRGSGKAGMTLAQTALGLRAYL